MAHSLKKLSATFLFLNFYLYSNETSITLQKISVADDTQEQIRVAALGLIDDGISALGRQQDAALNEEKRLTDNATRLRKELDENSLALLANAQLQSAILRNMRDLVRERTNYTPDSEGFMLIHAERPPESTPEFQERENNQGPQSIPFEIRQFISNIFQGLDAFREQVRQQAERTGLFNKP